MLVPHIHTQTPAPEQAQEAPPSPHWLWFTLRRVLAPETQYLPREGGANSSTALSVPITRLKYVSCLSTMSPLDASRGRLPPWKPLGSSIVQGPYLPPLPLLTSPLYRRLSVFEPSQEGISDDYEGEDYSGCAFADPGEQRGEYRRAGYES